MMKLFHTATSYSLNLDREREKSHVQTKSLEKREMYIYWDHILDSDR